MKRQFSKRVDVERRVLALVNGCIKSPILPGLSIKALRRWRAEGPNIPDDIFRLVESISTRASLDVNASRDVFSEEELQLTSSVDFYVQQLKDRLAALAH